jgi:hypothetical protein
MANYCIIETEDGWTVVEHAEADTAEQTAHRLGGAVIDPGPYETYEDAREALEALRSELDETEEETSDVPGPQVAEGRSEWDD